MRTYFDDALVTGWEGLEGTYGLPDPGDEHVVAAAVVGGAGVIATDNVKDFPATHLPPHLHVLDAKDFAADTADVDPARAARALHEFSIRRSHPRKEPLQWLAILVERNGMVDVGDILEPVLKTCCGDVFGQVGDLAARLRRASLAARAGSCSWARPGHSRAAWAARPGNDLASSC